MHHTKLRSIMQSALRELNKVFRLDPNTGGNLLRWQTQFIADSTSDELKRNGVECEEIEMLRKLPMVKRAEYLVESRRLARKAMDKLMDKKSVLVIDRPKKQA